MPTIRKEVEVYQDVDIEVTLDDFDDEDLIEEIVSRGISLEEVDQKASSWDFTRKMYEYFKSEMDKISVETEVRE